MINFTAESREISIATSQTGGMSVRMTPDQTHDPQERLYVNGQMLFRIGPEDENAIKVVSMGPVTVKVYAQGVGVNDASGTLLIDNFLLATLNFSGTPSSDGETKSIPNVRLTAREVFWKGNNDHIYLRVEVFKETTLSCKVRYNGGQVIVSEAPVLPRVTTDGGSGGTITATEAFGNENREVTLSQVANAGYTFKGYTIEEYKYGAWRSSKITVSNNKFRIGLWDVRVTGNYDRIPYAVSVASNPSGAGNVTRDKSTAKVGDTVTVSQTPATGYYFNGWTSSPSLSINGNGQFTMPAGAVTVTANYLKRSTGYLNKNSMEGGTNVVLTINADKSSYTHKYQLSFGSGMATSETSVAAGTSSVTISVPLSWCAQIPNATSKTGGTLTLKTYSGSTLIGTYEITGLTFTVPGSVVPTLADLTTDIIRTIDGVTYANVGSYYVQNHSGVRIRTTAGGVQGSTIASVELKIIGYSGNKYNKTQTAVSLDFTSGLLTKKGTCTIQVTATDSRGRKTTKTATITVTEYNNPRGTLSVWRVDEGGTADEFGERGQYSLTTAITAIGSNAIQVKKLWCNGYEYTNPNNTGNLMPDTRLALSNLREYEVRLTVADKFETSVIRATLPSGKFIIYVDSGGDRLGLMTSATRTIPAGKVSTIELSANAQIYIGNETLEDFIRRIANS